MRWLLWIILLVTVVWCAWWAILGFGMKTALDTWFEDRRTDGWQADYASLDLRGFPARVDADMTDIVLADTDGGVVINLPALQIGAPTYWPGDLTLVLPSDPISFVTAEGRSSLEFAQGAADLKLHPGAALELEQIAALTGPWSLNTNEQTVLSADNLRLTMDQNQTTPTRYKIDAEAANLRPGDAPRAALRLPDDWPLTFDTFTLDADIIFDKPWDISAVEAARPQPRQIKLKLAEAVWADLRLFFAADLEVDATGTPTGTLNIQAENWQVMLDLAERSGALSSSLRQQAESGLSTLARFSGDPNALDIQLNLRGGMMLIGFIPIGPAPKIVLR
ncbi:DUF2125 domain-containing protein [Ascidiaceihabitans sp.]|nr:DUF2125 domain-containing protein [Ascidiaceihabitans sp.]